MSYYSWELMRPIQAALILIHEITRAIWTSVLAQSRTGTTWSRSNIGFGTALGGGHLNIPLQQLCLPGWWGSHHPGLDDLL